MGMLIEMFEYANSHTDSLFGKWILISLYLVIFISIVINKGEREVKTAFIAAGTITAFSAVFLRLMGMITDGVLVVAVLAGVLPILISLFLGKD